MTSANFCCVGVAQEMVKVRNLEFWTLTRAGGAASP